MTKDEVPEVNMSEVAISEDDPMIILIWGILSEGNILSQVKKYFP